MKKLFKNLRINKPKLQKNKNFLVLVRINRGHPLPKVIAKPTFVEPSFEKVLERIKPIKLW